LPDEDLHQLVHSHLRRKQWEERLMATEIGRLFGGGGGAATTAPAEPGPTQVSGDDLFAMMRVEVKGG